MRGWVLAIGFTIASFGGVAPAAADHAPSFVVPTRPDVPVIVNGRDASYTIVEGDWGLARPGHMPLEVFGATYQPGYDRPGSYFPGTGRRPPYGRREVVPSPNAPPPPPAENFQRTWGAGSAPGPVTIDPPLNPPTVIVAPRQRRTRAAIHNGPPAVPN